MTRLSHMILKDLTSAHRRFSRLWLLLLMVSASLCPATAYAVGTPVGTVIGNTATLNYSISGTAQTPITDTANITVDEIIDVTVTWQDSANVAALSPSTAQVLTYLITNTGNGSETFTLSVNNIIGGDNFDPTNAAIYIDNGNGSFDGIGTETLYTGANNPTLDANATDAVTIFVLNDIPAALVGGNTGISNFTASSVTAGAAGAAPGTVLATLGDGGVDAVVGPTQATANADGTYVIQPVVVTIAKSATIEADPSGCSTAPCTPVPGATVRYSLTVTVSGTGTASALVISDIIPAGMTYSPGTITLNTIAKGDAPFATDGDEAEFAANTVTVNLGNINVAGVPVVNTITFDVTIN